MTAPGRLPATPAETAFRLGICLLLVASCGHDRTTPPTEVGHVPAAVWFGTSRIVTDEGRSSLRIPIIHHRDGGDVHIRVVGGSATEGTDYDIEHDVSLSPFWEGDTLAWSNLTIRQDCGTEPDENIMLELDDPDPSHVVAEPRRMEIILIEDDYSGPSSSLTWPLQVGQSRHYQAWLSRTYENQHSFVRLTTVDATVSGTTNFHGEAYSILDFPSEAGGTLLLRQDGQAIRGAHGLHGLDEADTTGTYNPARFYYPSLPWTLFDFAIPTGGWWVPYHAVIPDVYSADVLITNGPRVRAAVPAGVFENVRKVVFESRAGYIALGGHQEHTEYWVADNVGIIRMIGSYTTSEEGPNSGTFEYDLELLP